MDFVLVVVLVLVIEDSISDVHSEQFDFPPNFVWTNFWGGSRVGNMKPRVSNHKSAALTLVEVLVVIFILFVLAALLLPTLAPIKDRRRGQCVMNLKQIGLAYFVWAGDHNGKFPMQVSVTDGGTMELTTNGKNPWLNFLVMSNELNTPWILICPVDRDRAIATNFPAGFSAKNISYFVGLDAGTNHPQMFLSGDDNFAIGGNPVKSGLLELSTDEPIAWTSKRHDSPYQPHLWTPTRHNYGGNIGFADGSVMQTSNSGLTNWLQKTGAVTNRLGIP